MLPDDKLKRRLVEAEARLTEAEDACEHEEPGWRHRYHAAMQDLLALEREMAASLGEEYAIPVPFSLAWDTGAPLPHMLRSEYRTILIFLASVRDPNWDGTYVNVRDPADTSVETLGLVTFERCVSARFGDPNEEVLEGHPVHGRGLEPYTAQEIKNSRWKASIQAINSVHSEYQPADWDGVRHLVLWFHDSTFECLASGFHVERHQMSMRALLAVACSRLMDE